MTTAWSGQWVSDRLGISLQTVSGQPLEQLLGLALRRNPRRVQLLVSTVLGKHIPTDPRVIYDAGLRLGQLVGATLAREAESAAGPVPVVLGYAETATALGHSVADALGADYLHSTRRAVPGVLAVGGFEEAHSHASSHLLLPEDPSFFARDSPLVLVDDELSTGATALNTITLLHGLYPQRRQYLIAALVDLREEVDRSRMDDLAAQLGVRLDVVALSVGQLQSVGQLPVQGDLQQRGQALVAEMPGEVLGAGLWGSDSAGASPSWGELRGLWPTGVPDGGRHGVTAEQSQTLRVAAGSVAEAIRSTLQGDRVLVLGSEELMYAPLMIATALADGLAGDSAAQVAEQVGGPVQVRFSTTTRSPVLAVDEAGYAIRTVLRFDRHDDVEMTGDTGSPDRFAYNVAAPAGVAGFTDIVLVVDDVADTSALRAPGGLLDKLSTIGAAVQLVVLPSHRPAITVMGGSVSPQPMRGPAFGSYSPDEVAWLLTDLSDVELEAPTEEREEAIQSGGAHYAESLPVEYQPTVEYQQLFTQALQDSARRIAVAVGVVTELVLEARGDEAVLVSLARAGTPVGVLMRRWASFAHGLNLPHYAVSIVRGRGIDQVACTYLAQRHRSEDVMFVDGWTGKGAITRELSAAVEEVNRRLGSRFSPELAVLADTGACTTIYGTRDDFLIPSACLNSTVSGLVSRTVLNDLIGEHQFHGAKFYRELAAADVSTAFLDAVSLHFGDVAAEVGQTWPRLQASDRRPTWRGWDAVEKISAEYGINDVNLVKPGVGETTRVLLRRVPWKILMRSDVKGELGHVLHLAASRGVEVQYVDDLAYSCVGLIHPRFTRGAVGADGTGIA